MDIRFVCVCLLRKYFTCGDEDLWEETMATCPLKRIGGRNSLTPQFGKRQKKIQKSVCDQTHKYVKSLQNKRLKSIVT